MSPSNIVLATLWLRNCLRCHQPCTDVQAQSVLPTHVIDIHDPESPFLVKGGGRHDQYVTLSYKWGGSRKVTTTTANLQQHESSIPFRHLPRTFKEAIYIAHSLSFRWLWIDALCIVQDSAEKLREIDNMGLIFRRATLTLFATHGDDADMGLAIMRDPRTMRPCRVRVATTRNNTTLVSPNDITLLYQRRHVEPLFTRGWVLQEEILSVRGLYFGSQQLQWQCLCDDLSEENPGPRNQLRSSQSLGIAHMAVSWASSDRMEEARLQRSLRADASKSGSQQRWSHFEEWYSTVERYNDRLLTFNSDVLMALSGITSMISSTYTCTYLAGLWKEDLQVGLCWFVVGRKRTESTTLYGRARNKQIQVNPEYSMWSQLFQPFGPSQERDPTPSTRYPSWSWASKWGQTVRFCRPIEDQPPALVRHEGVAFIDDHAQAGAAAQNTFSTVSQSALKLIGRLRVAAAVRPKMAGKRHDSDAERVREVRDPTSGSYLGHVALDTAPATLRAVRIHCLLCAVYECDGKWILNGIALAPKVGFDGHFTRIGQFGLSDSGWFGELSIVDPASQPYSPPRDTTYLRMITVV